MCEIGKDFKNLNSYNSEMAKGMEDKLFFLNKLPDPSDDQIGTLGLVGGNKSLVFLHLFFHI